MNWAIFEFTFLVILDLDPEFSNITVPDTDISKITSHPDHRGKEVDSLP